MDRNGHGSHLVWMSGSNEMRLAGLWQKSHVNWYLKKKNVLYLTNSYWRRPTVTSTTSSSFASRWSGTRRCCCSRRLITSTTTSDASTTTKWGWSHFSSLLSFLSVSNGVEKKKETFRTPHTYHLCLFKNKRNRHDMTKRRNAHKLQEPDRHTCLSVHSSTVPEVAGGISKAAVTLIKRSTSSLIALAHKRGRSRSIHTHIDIYRRNYWSWELDSQ